MRFRAGDRVRITVEAPAAREGAWGAVPGNVGVITRVSSFAGCYGVLLDNDPEQLSAAFRDRELEPEK